MQHSEINKSYIVGIDPTNSDVSVGKVIQNSISITQVVEYKVNKNSTFEEAIKELEEYYNL